MGAAALAPNTKLPKPSTGVLPKRYRSPPAAELQTRHRKRRLKMDVADDAHGGALEACTAGAVVIAGSCGGALHVIVGSAGQVGGGGAGPPRLQMVSVHGRRGRLHDFSRGLGPLCLVGLAEPAHGSPVLARAHPATNNAGCSLNEGPSRSALTRDVYLTASKQLRSSDARA